VSGRDGKRVDPNVQGSEYHPQLPRYDCAAVGFLSKLREKSRGVMTKAEPAEGVAPVPESELRDRLRAISGTGVETGEDGGEIVVAWAAKVASVGPGGGDYTHVYRAIRVELDPAENEASGICFKTDTDAELGPGFLTAARDWERGQHIGSESFTVVAWLGAVASGGGAEGDAREASYKFSWSDLRDPVIDAVTGAGWTYKPKRV
jgi:hypothetical protein